jgi:AraC family transcriptional regulator
MDGLRAIQRFADEVERRIEEPFDIDQAIRMTYVSKYHFYRMFKAVVGISVYEYVKRRKLVQAAADLRTSEEDVLDIAFKFGFGSHENFTRNFKKFYHITPAKYRKAFRGKNDPNEKLTRIDVESIELDLKVRHGNATVQDQVERIEGLKLIGIQRRSHENNVASIFPFIQHFIQQVDRIPNRSSDTVYRLCYDISFVNEVAYYKEVVAVQVDDHTMVPSGMKALIVDGLNMIKYVHKGRMFQDGKDNILSTYQFLYGYRLTASNANLIGELVFEKYGDKFTSPYDEESQMEIYLSIE